MWLLPFFVAAAGVVVSLFIHILTFCAPSFVAPLRDFWFLHVAVMIVAAPAVVIIGLNKRQQSWSARWDDVTKFVPRWMRVLTLLAFAYATFNFFHTIYLNQGGTPKVEDGRFLLTEHGRIIERLTTQEYRKHQAYELRRSSGHWLVFYWIASIVYYVGMFGEWGWNLAQPKRSKPKPRH